MGAPGVYIDFFVSGSRRWGIELVRDSLINKKRMGLLREHRRRFEGEEGKYVALALRSYIVIDLGQVMPHPDQLAAEPDVLFAVFSGEFTSVTFFKHGEPCKPAIPLLDRPPVAT
jgi:hypothetical protein